MLFVCSIICITLKCHTSPEPLQTNGNITGVVKAAGETRSIFPAFIFTPDSLLGITDKYGFYRISSLEEGIYDLTCSALNYGDTTGNVVVIGGKTITLDFTLQPDSMTQSMPVIPTSRIPAST